MPEVLWSGWAEDCTMTPLRQRLRSLDSAGISITPHFNIKEN